MFHNSGILFIPGRKEDVLHVLTVAIQRILLQKYSSIQNVSLALVAIALRSDIYALIFNDSILITLNLDV